METLLQAALISFIFGILAFRFCCKRTEDKIKELQREVKAYQEELGRIRREQISLDQVLDEAIAGKELGALKELVEESRWRKYEKSLVGESS